MPRPSYKQIAHSDFEEAIDVLLTQESDLMILANGVWLDQDWKVEWIATMLAVSAYSEWERFIENLIYAHLCHDTSQLAATLGLNLSRKMTRDTCEAMFTSRGYLEFRNTSDLIGYCRRWLVSSPFELLTADQRQSIDQLRLLRNHIVHKSRHSEASLRKVLGNINVTTHLLQRRLGQTELRNYLLTLRDASLTMS
jgi:hypothetical protein